MLGEKSMNTKDSLKSKSEVIKKRVWELKKEEKKEKKCNIQAQKWGENVFEVENGWLLEQGKKVAKSNGKGKTHGNKFTLEKVGEKKKMKRLGKQEQNRRTDKRNRKLHIWIERKDN